VITLRPYQQDAVDAIYKYYEDGNDGNAAISMPTGSGKGFVQAFFVKDALEKFPSERILLVTHVKELIEQNVQKLQTIWPQAPIGIYSAGLGCRDVLFQLLFCGIQSVYKRAGEFGRISLIIVDECHRIGKKGTTMYRNFLADMKELNPEVKVIGLTATPYRTTSGLLTDGDDAIFNKIVYEANIRDLIKQGYLCKLTTKLGSHRADLSSVRVRAGEYVEGDLEKVMNVDRLVVGAVDETMDLCHDRKKLLVFCSGVKHAHAVCNEISSRGVYAACVTGKTPSEERAAIIDEFKYGNLRVVVNVNVLTTGFDVPSIDAIISLRPTKSPGLWCQTCGRGLRTHPNKENTLILDFAGNILEHGPIDRIRVKKKYEGGGIAKAPMKECPECRNPVFLSNKVCPECGYVFTVERKPKHGTKASGLRVISDGKPWELEVDKVSYKKHDKPGKPPSMKVTYRCGLESHSEWICIEHKGYAKQKAALWWKVRGWGEPMPSTVDKALTVAHFLKKPKKIKVRQEGKYTRVVGYRQFYQPFKQQLELTHDDQGGCTPGRV
jgi:DNA repair protein RadD